MHITRLVRRIAAQPNPRHGTRPNLGKALILKVTFPYVAAR